MTMHTEDGKDSRRRIWYSKNRLRKVISEIHAHLPMIAEFRLKRQFTDLNRFLMKLEKVFAKTSLAKPGIDGTARGLSENDRPAMSTKRPYLLVADDDEDDRLIVADEFGKRFGIPVELAESGLALFEYLDACPTDMLPSVVLIDLKMPDVDGWAILQNLAAIHRYDALIKIVWSTAHLSADAENGKRQGAAECLSKPGSNAELDEMVGKLSAYFEPIAGSV